MVKALSIAVIGSGVSGLGAAWLLSKTHRVTLFETAGYAGGHANTVDVPGSGATTAVDTGFIVYNTASYPNLIALFDHLDVPTSATNMGFAVSLDNGRYEYSGDGLGGLFGQPANIVNPHHWRMILDMLRFFREAQSGVKSGIALTSAGGPTLGQYLAQNGYSDAFVRRHIVPMAAAIWSTPSADIMDYPAAAFIRFFQNHGLLQVNDRPAWRTVVGGSRSYVNRLLAAMPGRLMLDTAVTAIVRGNSNVTIVHGQGRQEFDACVIAAHADDALGLLSDPDPRERAMLGAFRYTPNRAVLHDDPSFMPKRRRLWSSWNYLADAATADASLSLTYWMNTLQPLNTTRDLFVTLNPRRAVARTREIAAFEYRHPLFDRAAMAAQGDLWSLQGRRNTWFCGSYFGYGFHEDGLQAGLAVAEDIGGVRRPWQVANESGRIVCGGSPRSRSPLAEAAA